MRRHLLGILTLLFLAVALALTIWPQAEYAAYHAGAWRLGVFLAVLWIAYPQVVDLPLWIVGAVPALVILLAVRPRWFFYALPVVVLVLIFRPRRKTPAGAPKGR